MSKIYLFILIILISNLQSKTPNKKIVKPVIGIYGNPNPINDDTNLNSTRTPTNYAYWLESFGAEIMMIHYFYDNATIDEILSKVNGIIFIGGGRDFNRSLTWERKATYIIMKAKEMFLPIWGTCQGFQLIGTIISDDYTLLKYPPFDDYVKMHPLEITDNSTSMFKLFQEKDYKILTEEDSTFYYHTWGFYPDEWDSNEYLQKYLRKLSTAKDSNGLEFVNAFEAKSDSIKFFGSQFHPELNPFRRYNFLTLPLETNSLKVSQLLGMQFVEECRYYKEISRNSFDESDRDKFDFIYTYSNETRADYDYYDESFVFWKKKEISKKFLGKP